MPNMRNAMVHDMDRGIFLPHEDPDAVGAAIDTAADLAVTAMQQGLLTVARRINKGLPKPPTAPYVTPDAKMFWEAGWKAGCMQAVEMLKQMASEVIAE